MHNGREEVDRAVRTRSRQAAHTALNEALSAAIGVGAPPPTARRRLRNGGRPGKEKQKSFLVAVARHSDRTANGCGWWACEGAAVTCKWSSSGGRLTVAATPPQR